MARSKAQCEQSKRLGQENTGTRRTAQDDDNNDYPFADRTNHASEIDLLTRNLQETTTRLHEALAKSETQRRVIEDLEGQLAQMEQEKLDVGALLRKASNRVTRLEREKRNLRVDKDSTISGLRNEVARLGTSVDTERQSAELRLEDTQHRLDAAAQDAQQTLEKLTAARRDRDRYRKQAVRARETKNQKSAALKKISTVKAKNGNMYTPEHRRLVRRLAVNGLSNRGIRFAIKIFSEEWGIKVSHNVSDGSVRRFIDEGGHLADVQLGREIVQAEGHGISTDSTTIRKIGYDSRHVRLPVPSYARGADPSKKQFRTRMLDIDHELDHTAETQFAGDLAAGNRVLDAYKSSPMALEDGATVDNEDFVRRMLWQNMDHASDGKKKLALMVERKEEIYARDLGRLKLKTLGAEAYIKAVISITQDELDAELDGRQLDELRPEERGAVRNNILVRKLGQDEFDKLSDDEKTAASGILFAGCMCHKDLNCFKYAATALAESWSADEQPVILANKANDSTIQLSENPNSAAVRKAIESSGRGIVKLNELMAAMMRNKNHITGYQFVGAAFVEEEKRKQYPEAVEKGLIKPNELYPDAQQSRFCKGNPTVPVCPGRHRQDWQRNPNFQSNAYGVAELFQFGHIYEELIQTMVDGKTNSGFENHMESNILKGLKCTTTRTEAAALALYSMFISWPYMHYARGGSLAGKVTFLETVNFHRRIVPLCQKLANALPLILDPNTPDSELTIDGEPVLKPLLRKKIRDNAATLPALSRAVAATFTGAAKGWTIFTVEFAKGGPIDKLSAFLRALMDIDTSNDDNEGNLGGLRDYFKTHPNGAVATYAALAKMRKNDTEAFIAKHVSQPTLVQAMRKVREKKKGHRAFRRVIIEQLRMKAVERKAHRERTQAKKAENRAQLEAASVVLDSRLLSLMSKPELKTQFDIYWKILLDPVVVALEHKSKLNKQGLLDAVTDAAARHQARVSEVLGLGDDGDAEMEDTEWGGCGTGDDDEAMEVD
uniref:Uncharacterized protein n=1 Tax=Mycena chlorophos TaxID=658473 RepID=A0ABQ0L118_MYCCL|nr:predicted protein [Mycena chlorophos]